MKNMKNLLFISLISLSFSLVSCVPQDQYDDMSDPRNNQPNISGYVQVEIHSGSTTTGPQGGIVPTVPVMIPVTSGRVYRSGTQIPSQFWFTEYYPVAIDWYNVIVTIGNSDYQVAATHDLIEDMQVFAIHSGYDYVNVSIGTHMVNGQAIPQIISYY